jgi:hypothetical protein
MRTDAAARGRVWWFGAIVLWLLVVYGPGIGHGFVKDDVAWVSANHVASFADLRTLALRSNGFYRPLVAASFALDRAVYGIEPFGYGVTNLLLLIASAAALAWMARGVGLSLLASLMAAAIWAFNLHGIHMAVLWLSGRTELWLVLCAFLSAGALARGWPIAAGLAAFAAMLAKEQAVMLPVMLTAWAFVLDRSSQGGPRASARPASGSSLRAAARLVWPSWLALAVYFALRSRTAAYTPGTSPWFYRFTFDPVNVLTNVGEYLDRACTFSFIVVLLCALLAWKRPTWTPELRRIATLAAIWFIGGYALTIFLPVRSSLYACLPTAGIAMLAAATVAPLLAMSRRAWFAAALPIVLLPVYWSRNERWVELADLGADAFAMVRNVVHDTPDVQQLVFEDDRDTRRSLVNTYGVLLPPAVTLAAGRTIPVWLDPPPDDWQGSQLTRPPTAPNAGVGATADAGTSGSAAARIATLRLQDGRLVRVR